MKSTERRKDILRQLAKAADGLRINEVRGMSAVSAGEYIRAMHRDRQVDAVALKPGASTSSRPICRYVINDAGRAALAKAGA